MTKTTLSKAASPLEASSTNSTRVSVIITTLSRPTVLPRAIASVLSQTYHNLELLIVIDGPDEATRAAVGALSDARIQIVALPTNVGIAVARNTGVSRAVGQWVAFLDDDDEWLPTKLERQVLAANELGGKRILISSQFIERGVKLERVMPHRAPIRGEPLSEFMFCRKGLLSRSGTVQTSTYFASRTLALEVPFRKEVRSQEDWDWLMRSVKRADRPFYMVREPLAIYNDQSTSGREGAVADFDQLWNYAHQNRSLFTPRAFSFYLATRCAPSVRLSSMPYRRWQQVYRGMKTGEMTLRALAFAVAYAIFPIDTRRFIRHFITLGVLPLRKQ